MNQGSSWASVHFLPIFLLLQVRQELRDEPGCLDHLGQLGPKGTMALLEIRDRRGTVEHAVSSWAWMEGRYLGAVQGLGALSVGSQFIASEGSRLLGR